MKYWIRLIFLFFCLFTLPQAYATHIVGGEIQYRYLGSDNYEVTLKVYRDCYLGIPPFDDPAYIWVYDTANTLLGYVPIPAPPSETLAVDINDPCLVVPPTICVENAVYLDTILLPYLPGGYQLSYIRCCRNRTILNSISRYGISPDSSGSTYYLQIPDTVKVAQNSSPIYRYFPPIGICANKPLDFDHSAYDLDGDSLVYSICTPYDGGSVFNPYAFDPTENPPFDTIIWRAPYSLDNVLGGEPLRIDPVTGRLTAIPNTIGQFVVGICVREYRKGVFLTENKRDFQFNIVDCQPVVEASFSAPDPECNSLAVIFDNTTTGGSTFYWDFGDGTFSGDQIPQPHTYADTGRYTVTLYVNRGGICADSFTRTISVQYRLAEVGFDTRDPGCTEEGGVLLFNNYSSDPIGIDSVSWTFSNGYATNDFDASVPVISGGEISATLTVYPRNGCIQQLTKTYDIGLVAPFTIRDTVALCGQSSVQLPLEIAGQHTFSWMPREGLDDPFAQNPYASPANNTTYTVTITSVSSNGTRCIRRGDVTVLMDNIQPLVILTGEELVCGDTVHLTAVVENAAYILWSYHRDFTDTISYGTRNTSIQLVQTSPVQWYYVKVISGFCESTDSINVRQILIDYSARDTAVCMGEEVVIDLDIAVSGNVYSIQWYIDGEPVQEQGDILVFTPESSLTVSFEISTEEGCLVIDSIAVVVYPNPEVSAMAEPAIIAAGGQSVLTAIGSTQDGTYHWVPEESIADPDSAATLASPLVTTTYTVVYSDENGCIAEDTVTVRVEKFPCTTEAFFIPSAFSPNGDGKNDVMRVRTANELAVIHFMIFNRWGEMVFETSDPANGWDGRYKGRDQQSNVFGYYFEAECPDGNKIIKQGNITLLR